MKAGKVILLKSPKASKNPRIRPEAIDDRFYSPYQLCTLLACWLTYLITNDPFYQYQTPRHEQRLNRIGKCMSLQRPRHIRGSHQHDSLTAVSGRGYQLLYGPVLKHKTQSKHHHSQSVVYCRWRDHSCSIFCPYPLQQCHRDPIHRPQREDASDGRGAGPLPCSMAWIRKEVA